jgi:hypothetical protein
MSELLVSASLYHDISIRQEAEDKKFGSMTAAQRHVVGEGGA